MVVDHSRLAVLHDPEELHPPSDTSALQYLQHIAKKYDITVDLLTKTQVKKLPKYHGLFVRAGTHLDHYTYRWAELAESLGMTVIDTARGISLGCNKTLQYELFNKFQVPIPKTHIIFDFDNIQHTLNKINPQYPLVIKAPDGSWSNGVFKMESEQECLKTCADLLKKYFSVVLQEYVYTKFDWRIAILNHQPLFACKYYMVSDHWQIIKRHNGQILDEGEFETVALTQIPMKILKAIDKLYKFLDKGLYGIDLKETDKGILVIEINDTPNIYRGIEDECEQHRLYIKILETFAKKSLQASHEEIVTQCVE